MQHELDELALLRFLEVTYWKPSHAGLSLVQHIERTISWRESFGAHRIKPAAVEAQNAEGKMYVRGADR